MLCACLLLSFGRTTFGGLISVVPGHADLFFRRFLMGAQLAAIYLAGLGAAEAATHGRRLPWLSQVPAAVLLAAAVAYLVPALRYIDGFDAANAAGIAAQRLAQRRDNPQLAALAAVLRQRGGGRAYAGSPSDWGQYLTAGTVPVYQYLDSLDTDEVGYTLRTASLMSQPEHDFDAGNARDYSLLGIRYLVLPASHAPPALPLSRRPVLLLRNNLVQVYQLPASSYFQVADTTGTITASRADIGSQTQPYLRSALPGQRRYLTVAYAGARAAPPTTPGRASTTRPPGTVLTTRASLADCTASATVRPRRPAVVVLSASYDPGWSATIDGRPAAVQIVTPALTAIAAPPGTHRITFRYTGFGNYPELLALALLALTAAAALTRRRTASAASPASDISPEPADERQPDHAGQS